MTDLKILLDNFPFLLGTVLACLCSYRVGVFNLAIQAVIINSGLAFAWVVSVNQPVWLGLLAALLMGILTSLLYSFLITVLELEQIVSGIAINMVSSGFTTLVTQGHLNKPLIPIPEDVSNSRHVQYLFLTLLLMSGSVAIYLLTWSKFAPRLKAIGENIHTAWLCDLPIKRYRNYCLIMGAVLASLGGVCFSLRYGFDNNQWKLGTAYLALAIVIASRGKIKWTIVGVLAFFLVNWWQLKISGAFSEILPNALMIVIIFVFSLTRYLPHVDESETEEISR